MVEDRVLVRRLAHCAGENRTALVIDQWSTIAAGQYQTLTFTSESEQYDRWAEEFEQIVVSWNPHSEESSHGD